tara:strand:- start:404 stop:1486 length:1083 start_codon:yes stop_codon:yes gene_type:complete
MSMQVRTYVSLNEAMDDAVASAGKVTWHWQGEMGVGKTSVASSGSDKLGMRFVFIDCTQIDIADIGVMMPNVEKGYAEFLFNKHWGFHLDEPLFIVIDELTKAPKAVQAMLHGLLTHPRRIGSINIHPDSIVITTGNLTVEGVGDRLQNHTANRVITKYIRKPTADEWILWASQNGIHPTVMAWVKREPQLMQSFVDDPDGQNPYISNPKRNTQQCVTPRSLEMASHCIWDYFNGRIEKRNLRSSLEGAIGLAGGAQLMTFIDLVEELPSPDDIIEDPENAIVPESPPAVCITTVSALTWVDSKPKLDAWFTYMKRLSTENQALWLLQSKDNRKLNKLVQSHKAFGDWAVANKHLYGLDS